MVYVCGNYNNDLRDDFKMSNGNLTSVANEFGSSWLFGNTTLSCGVTSFSNSCQASDLIKARQGAMSYLAVFLTLAIMQSI